MNNQQPDPHAQKPQPADLTNWLYFFCHVHGTAMLPFLRHGSGSEAYALNGVLMFLVLLLLAIATKNPACWLFFGAWFIAICRRRGQCNAARKRGEIIHSRYDGDPWLALKVPFVKRHKTAREFVEPMMCFISGALLCTFSIELGALVMAGFVTLMIKNAIEEEITCKRLERMRDASIENAWYAERFRQNVEE